jgi:YkoY family integral membrane protein
MDFIQTFFGSDPKAAIFIILNLILIESLLSIDNAAVLATMVMDLPDHLRGLALKYGILGAYVFRGLCLIFATFLVKVTWLKALGGLYLCWLTFKFFKDKNSKTEGAEKHAQEDKEHNPLYQKIVKTIGPFWSTVILVEVVDLAFSIDNVFAAVAFTDKIGLICLGVFIGILAMRFAAGAFVDLMKRFSFLDDCAYAVIGILGLKLVSSYICDFSQGSFCKTLNGHNVDLFTSLLTIAVFAVPILTSVLFNFPKHDRAS